jgi:Immunity protein Imm1
VARAATAIGQHASFSSRRHRFAQQAASRSGHRRARRASLIGEAGRADPFGASLALRQNWLMQLRWADGPGLEIAGQDQLDDALDALLATPAGSEPLVAYLIGGAGALGLGLDPEGGGLLLFAASGPGRGTLPGAGDPRGGTEDLAYSVSGQRYTFSGRCRIAAHTVRAAARQYLATGELPSCVAWEPEPGAEDNPEAGHPRRA